MNVNEADDPNVGSAQDDPANSSSASKVLSVLAPVALFALIWFFLFLVLRKKFPRNYRPRTFLGSLREHERSPRMPDGLFNWFGAFIKIPDTYVLCHHSLDGYFFLRFLKICVVMCLVGCAITWPVLFPINITGGGTNRQLDILTMGNVTNQWKLFAHAGCAVIFFSFVIYTITRESIYYINLRQAYLLSPYYSSRISSRTVLFTSVPSDYMDPNKLRHVLGPHIRRIWPATDVKELAEKVEDRDNAAMKLEAAETKLITAANGARIKAEAKNDRSPSEEAAISHDESGSMAARYLDPKKRPTHKLKPIIGKKVDTIDWCRSELSRLIPEVERMQHLQRNSDAKMGRAVFVEFDSLTEAQAAFQSVTHHQVLQMSPRYTGVDPSAILWSNLRINWWERIVRQILTTAFVVALIIFWSIPVALVGAISNVDSLKATPGLGWLSFLDEIPDVIMGVVEGLLPTILLAVLMALLPIILRLMAKLSGVPTLGAVELAVQNYYFGFQVVQVFLVATLGSAASAAIADIAEDPLSVTDLLAENIPKASSFFLAYFVLQGLAIVSSVLVGLVGLVLFFVLGKFLDKTPRKMYNRWITLTGLGWGTLLPIYTNLFVIAICYAAIAPLVLGFAAIGLFLFYFAYRYNLLFVSNAKVETMGLIYPRALQQLFVGLYIAEVCLIGMFAIRSASGVGAVGPLIIMVLMLIFTALYHVSLNSALTPLLNYLPKSLAAEERSLLEAERAHNGVGNGEYVDGVEKTMDSQSSSTTRKRPNFFTKWLRPDIHADYRTMRHLVPNEVEITYDERTERDAYFHPAIASVTPLLWIPRDPVGISRQEVRDTSRVIPITDEGAFLDEKNKVVWDAEDGRPPIYQDPVYY
ncbi:hypothetical protein MBLNU230_g1775t1 [Neophaeotheca triangularis]